MDIKEQVTVNHSLLITKLDRLQSDIQKVRRSDDELAKARLSALLDGMNLILSGVEKPERHTVNLIEAVRNLKSQLFMDFGKANTIDETALKNK